MPKIETRTLTNINGCSIEISNYGATITSLKVPNKYGEITNVVVGLATPQAYTTPSHIAHNLYLGCTIGRYAGRISNTKEDKLIKDINLTFKNGVHLHGGTHGFDKKYWTFKSQENSQEITLSYVSKHLEEGYPGNLEVSASFILTENNEVTITYTAITDTTTHVNLTNHSYFNLNGSGSILDHYLQVASKHYLEVDSNLIPTGTYVPTLHSYYDLSQKSQIGNSTFKGYDDTFILEDKITKASLYAPTSGIQMDVETNQPAMVIYTPKIFPELPFKDNLLYTAYPAICFENQCFPDAPNNTHFPSTVIHPGDVYKNKSVFKFSIVDSSL
ncbi:aldose 1-epimerase [Dokdonia pacifica]|uniref:Aldose 1-epimerase n=1 Tax=Dokdonia pacifica TaxID=1627892 RepID=A0A239C5W9_9FLAO|nr:aldose epimerase family protein [Dokdonia pacifica]GGG26448.1 aldose 1-epimerase [Dokdonia pacifica]SNS15606.1 aldose 1-epimerase [Dokdonia pacifica]